MVNAAKPVEEVAEDVSHPDDFPSTTEIVESVKNLIDDEIPILVAQMILKSYQSVTVENAILEIDPLLYESALKYIAIEKTKFVEIRDL